MHNMVSSVVIQHAPICWSAINDWTLSIQDNKSVIVAYIDFSRAFDTVSHKKLLAKLYTYGIRSDVLLWLERYFNKRTHQTRVGDCVSAEANLTSGVVQGSGIGPVSFLFIIRAGQTA